MKESQSLWKNSVEIHEKQNPNDISRVRWIIMQKKSFHWELQFNSFIAPFTSDLPTPKDERIVSFTRAIYAKISVGYCPILAIVGTSANSITVIKLIVARRSLRIKRADPTTGRDVNPQGVNRKGNKGRFDAHSSLVNSIAFLPVSSLIPSNKP